MIRNVNIACEKLAKVRIHSSRNSRSGPGIDDLNVNRDCYYLQFVELKNSSPNFVIIIFESDFRACARATTKVLESHESTDRSSSFLDKEDQWEAGGENESGNGRFISATLSRREHAE